MVGVGRSDWCRIRTAGAQVAHMNGSDGSGIVQRIALVSAGCMIVQD